MLKQLRSLTIMFAHKLPTHVIPSLMVNHGTPKGIFKKYISIFLKFNSDLLNTLQFCKGITEIFQASEYGNANGFYEKTSCPQNWTEKHKNSQFWNNPSSIVRSSMTCTARSKASPISRAANMMLPCYLVARDLCPTRLTCLLLFPYKTAVLPR